MSIASLGSKMRPLTDKQRDYIEYMLSNAYTDENDQKALKEQLKRTGKKSIAEFTVSEASDLITALIEKEIVYKLVCGETIAIDRWMVHSFDVMGESKACLNHCPKGRYIGSCQDYRKHEHDMYEELGEAIKDE